MNEKEKKTEDMEKTSILPGLNEEDTDVILPGFEEDNIENEILPGIERRE